MYLQDIALGLVKPGQDDDLLPDRDPVESRQSVLMQFEPRVGRSLAALPGRLGARLERRPDVTDWPDGKIGVHREH